MLRRSRRRYSLGFIGGACLVSCVTYLGGASSAEAVSPPTVVEVQVNAPTTQSAPMTQKKPTIAVHPVDASILIAGSDDEPVRAVRASGVYTSSDGGKTWGNRGLLDDQAGWKASDLASAGDPEVVFGPRPSASGGFGYTTGARAYYVTRVSSKDARGPGVGSGGGAFVAVSYSDDNGVTWSAPVLVGGRNNPVDVEDPEVTADDNPTSPGFGRVYVSWTVVRGAGSGSIRFAASADGGRTFGVPQSLTPAAKPGSTGGPQRSAVATGPDGTVYVAFEQDAGQYVAVSRDLGRSFAEPAPVAAVSDLADPAPAANVPTGSFPSIAADPRSGSTTVYVAWAERAASGGRVVVARSADRGANWGSPTTVSTDAEGYPFLPGMDVAPTGRVDVAYQALRGTDPAASGVRDAAVDAWYVSRPADTSAWTTPAKTSPVSSAPTVDARSNLSQPSSADGATLVSSETKAWFIRAGSGTSPTPDLRVAVVTP
jgi:hypothetical protein